MKRKLVYRFEPGNAEGRAAWRDLLGGKGANLAEMANLGVPVPSGFTITTQACREFQKTGKLPEGLTESVREGVAWLEGVSDKHFGGRDNPLLVSVRSGGPHSMPGMMDTILDLGLTDETLAGLTARGPSDRFAWDSYRRFLSMYGDVVLKIERERFDEAMNDARRGVARHKGLAISDDPSSLTRLIPDTLLSARDLEQVVAAFKGILAEEGDRFPSDPFEQLMAAVVAVFESWNNPRAKLYRQMHHISEEFGTAVNVQMMVFGNLGDTSATGVAFTRDPSTGEKRFFGEWLPNAQGEDVVAGIRTPRPLAKSQEFPGESLEEAMPENYAQLLEIQDMLEQHFRDMQDMEFTIEEGTLHVLQTRNGKRSARAAVRISVEMVGEGLIHEDEAILRVEPTRLHELLFPTIDPKAKAKPFARGLAAAPGAVSGEVVFTAEEAEEVAAANRDVILLRVETSPEDLKGMKVARGIVTVRGGATSHAAVVARGMGRPCVVGCATLEVDGAAGVVSVHGPDGARVLRLKRGDVITIDGTGGGVYQGKVATIDSEMGDEMQTLMRWADKERRMAVRTNADTPAQAEQALRFGAEGIGLCRTEHMFFDEGRIKVMRRMILASDEQERQRALDKLLPFQRDDFAALFRVMGGLPVNIRLLDPPLHEFIPTTRQQMKAVAEEAGVTLEVVERRSEELHESNPMLGHRGVRLAISYPEIPRMQVRAIFEAACAVAREGVEVRPEIMIPLTFSVQELLSMRKLVSEVAEGIFELEGIRIAYKFGTMIELPRAALLADQLAEVAEFFSFGTNDLTQTTLGLSRDDATRFLPAYVEAGLLPDDPFRTLDRDGVGALVDLASNKGRAVRPDMSLGLCGEHGGDPVSIDFCEQVGLSYVSCSPFRVPIARVAAAQAVLRRRADRLARRSLH